MLELPDIRNALRLRLLSSASMPCHVMAFSGWIVADAVQLEAAIKESSSFTGQARRPEHVAAFGYGARAGLLSNDQLQIFFDDVRHLGGRAFFSPGRPPRFEVDGIALLGVSLGAAHVLQAADGAWLTHLLEQSSGEVASDEWQLGLVRLARLARGERDMRIIPADLAVAAAARGLGTGRHDDREQAWRMAVGLVPHDSGPAREAARLAAFEYEFSRLGEINLGAATRNDLVRLLQNVSRAMKRWTFEKAKRTPRSEITKWQIENEYHVQNLLWAVLAPVFPDLEDEENLPSVGHLHPRADLGIPSLRTIVEVKFLRRRGQSGFTGIIEEVAADTSLYLSRTAEYDNIVAFVWDHLAQTEQHHELKSGLERIRGISAAVILPRPSSMQ
jgi:hypothetical protein